MELLNVDSLRARIDAAGEILGEGEYHPVPSPSGIMHCLRQQTYSGLRVPKTNRPPIRSLKRMESGSAIESWWAEVYNTAGFTVMKLDGGSRVSTPAGSGEFDRLLIDNTTGEKLLLELKDMDAWTFLNILDKGVQGGDENYWGQVQCYLDSEEAKSLGITRVIFHVGQAGPSSLAWIWKKIKKREGRPPDYIVEVIEKDYDTVLVAKARATKVSDALEREVILMREYNPRDGKFPCGDEETPYCSWRELCLKDG